MALLAGKSAAVGQLAGADARRCVGCPRWRARARKSVRMAHRLSLRCVPLAAIESLAWPEDAPRPDLVLVVVPREQAQSLQKACAEAARVPPRILRKF